MAFKFICFADSLNAKKGYLSATYRLRYSVVSVLSIINMGPDRKSWREKKCTWPRAEEENKDKRGSAAALNKAAWATGINVTLLF